MNTSAFTAIPSSAAYPHRRALPISSFQEAIARLRYSIESMPSRSSRGGRLWENHGAALSCRLPSRLESQLIYVSDRNVTERVFYDNVLTQLGVIRRTFGQDEKAVSRVCRGPCRKRSGSRACHRRGPRAIPRRALRDPMLCELRDGFVLPSASSS